MKVYTLRIDREAMRNEIDSIDGVSVRLPDSMSKSDAEKMIVNNIPDISKYYYSIHCVDNMD